MFQEKFSRAIAPPEESLRDLSSSEIVLHKFLKMLKKPFIHALERIRTLFNM